MLLKKSLEINVSINLSIFHAQRFLGKLLINISSKTVTIQKSKVLLLLEILGRKFFVKCWDLRKLI